MWNFMSKMGCPDPTNKFPTSFQKGGYQAFHTLIGTHKIPNFQEKQFDYLKNTDQSMRTYQNIQNYSCEKPLQINSSQQMPENKTSNMINMCNSKKKKKKRRRRRRKSRKTQDKNQNETPVVQRQRQISVAESEDSYVIFCDGEVEERFSEVSDNETETTEEYSSDSTVVHKKVRFADDNLCEVHPMIMWSYAYQAARKGPWEKFARDRDRFSRRISNTEAIIGHVFSKEHRSRIFEERFANRDF